MTQTISDLMATTVATCGPEQSLQEAAALMKQHNVGSIPVVENGKLCGIITDRDITLRATADGEPSSETVRECMSTDLTVASSTMDVHEAARMMAQHQIRRLPVVENGQLMGMLAIGDLAQQNIYTNEAGDALHDVSQNSTKM